MNKKQNIPTNEKKAAEKALLKEVASKLSSRDTLFPEKVARAKAYLKISVFPPEFGSKKA
jgi:hypothetical protein